MSKVLVLYYSCFRGFENTCHAARNALRSGGVKFCQTGKCFLSGLLEPQDCLGEEGTWGRNGPAGQADCMLRFVGFA